MSKVHVCADGKKENAMIELKKSDVEFNQELHIYTLGDITLQGITGMIGRQLFPQKYSDVPKEILDKAAKRGSLIHETIEVMDDLGVTSDSEEAKGYTELKELYGLQYEASEYLVSDNRHFASCIDKVYRESGFEFSLGDIKTTYNLDKDYIRWQLSIYAYLFELQNPECKVVRLFGIWLRGNIHELVEVQRIPDEVIKNLLESEVEGRQFVNPYAIPTLGGTLPDRYKGMEKSIVEILEQARIWVEKKKELSEGVMKAMVEAGAYSWKGDSVCFTRKKDSIRKEFDKKAFEKDYPDLYKKYMKETPVIGSVTLKVI